MPKLDTRKPTPLAGETPKPFRLRAVAWILSTRPGMNYDEITDAFNAAYPEREIVRDSIIRDLDVLEARGQATATEDEADRRRLTWS